MNGSFFVDTNILIYAYDRSEPEKQSRALDVLDHLAVTGTGVLSTQVLAEFFTIATRKIPFPLTLEEGYSRLEKYLQSWPFVEIKGMVVLEAARGARDYGLNFWDAQIWATARLNQIPIVLSEDFQDGRVIEGVRFANPFAESFQLLEGTS